MWSSLALVVSPSTLGTAIGITTSMQMIGCGICNLIIGQILSKKYSKYVSVKVHLESLGPN